MVKLYDNLLASEWRTAITPGTLGDDVLKGLRIVTGDIASTIGLTLATETIRPFYSVISINVNDIEYVNALAVATPDDPGVMDLSIKAGPLRAGYLSYEQFMGLPDAVGKYRFKSDAKGIDAFGLGITDHLALVGRDFNYKNGYYWFNEDPAKFGSIGIGNDGKSQLLTLPCLGGELSTEQLPLGVAYRHCSDSTVMDAINEAVYGTAPNGITNALLYAVGGMKLSVEQLVRVWEEGTYLLGIDSSGHLVYAPKDSGVKFIAGAAADISALLLPGDYILVPTSVTNYIIVKDSTNTLANYPGIAQDFPQLGGTFTGWDLIIEMTKAGCVFYTLTYINNSAGAQQALGNFLPAPGKTIITTIVEGTGGMVSSIPISLPQLTVTATSSEGTTNLI